MGLLTKGLWAFPQGRASSPVANDGDWRNEKNKMRKRRAGGLSLDHELEMLKFLARFLWEIPRRKRKGWALSVLRGLRVKNGVARKAFLLEARSQYPMPVRIPSTPGPGALRTPLFIRGVEFTAQQEMDLRCMLETFVHLGFIATSSAGGLGASAAIISKKLTPI